MNHKGVIFDLDGTLLDTLKDIADSANRVLTAHGFPPHDKEAYRWFVGDGSAILMTRALPEDQRTAEQIDSCFHGFLEDYGRNWDRATRPYEGISELLKRLEERHIKVAVVTNKPHRFTGVMMARYFSGHPFDAIFGQQPGIPKKPDPRQALAAAEKMGVTPSACLFIGDSAVDIQTAINSGMYPVGVGWGFRTAAELAGAGAATIIHHPLELLDLLDR